MRKEWKFPYSTAVVFEGAKAKLNFHKQRLDFWRQKQAETMEKIKKVGLEIQTSLAGANYSNVARGFGAQVVVDATMQRDLDECEGKIHEHEQKRQNYLAWTTILGAARGDVTLELDYDDYAFFFGE